VSLLEEGMLFVSSWFENDTGSGKRIENVEILQTDSQSANSSGFSSGYLAFYELMERSKTFPEC
jgi:hypothetical protein